jgi:hypothetical protein
MLAVCEQHAASIDSSAINPRRLDIDEFVSVPTVLTNPS